MKKLEQLKNLLVMVLADSSMTEREIKFVAEQSRAWGLDDSELSEAIEYALTNREKITVPETRRERLAMLEDLIRVMAADGKLADVEKELFARAAVAMDISNNEVNELIDKLVRGQK